MTPMKIETREMTNLHWAKGGTGSTNFNAKKLPLFKMAVWEYGKPDVWIHSEPFDNTKCYFKPGEEMSFHRSKSDISEFWKIFREIEKDTNETL